MTGVMAVAPRSRNAVALIGALILVVGAAWIVQRIRTSSNPVNAATVWAAYLGVATLLASLLAYLISWWWKGRRATAAVGTAVQGIAAANQLAQRMHETWRLEATERRISTPAPAEVCWRRGPREVTPPWAEVNTAPVSGTGPPALPDLRPGGPNTDPPGVLLDAGIVTRLHDDVYYKLAQGRLVLLGGPGAGKTGAMILLLLAALEYRNRAPETRRGEIPVPVWLTLGGWDPITQTLHQWAAATIYRDHPYLRAPEYGPDAPGELLRTGRVTLFLDGLDEMAPAAQAPALARIDREGAGLRLVLSSRPEEYQQAVSAERIYKTAVIELQAVGPDEARAYLVRDQIGAQHDRWARVGDYLTSHPDSIAARALNNPLTLSLARLTYDNQNPTLLTDPTQFATVAALRNHLIDRILITAYPDEPQRAHATWWLAWIAHHLGTDRDIAWWHIPTWIPEGKLYLGVRLVVGLAGGLVVGLAGGLAGGLGVGLVLAIMVVLGFGIMVTPGPGEVGKEPQTILPRWPRPRVLLGLLLLVLGSGLVVGLTGGLGVGLGVGLLFGLTALLTLLEFWTEPLPHASTATPIATYRIDCGTSIRSGLTGGLVLGLGVGLALGLTGGLLLGLVGGLAVGLPFGLRGVLRGGAVKVSFTELVLAITGAGRVKFIRVLEDAHHRQVLRQAGAVYQFRHAELQDHLAKIHRSHVPPSTSTIIRIVDQAPR